MRERVPGVSLAVIAMFDALQCCVSRCDAEPIVRAKRVVHLESRSDEHDDLADVKAKVRLEGRRSPAESQRCQEEKTLHGAWNARQNRGPCWKSGFLLLLLLLVGSASSWRSGLAVHKPRSEALIADVGVARQSVLSAARNRTVATSATHPLESEVSATEAPKDDITPSVPPLILFVLMVTSVVLFAHFVTESCNAGPCVKSARTEEELTRELLAKCKVAQLQARRRHRLLSGVKAQTQVKEARQKLKPREKLMTWLSTRAFDCSQWFSTDV